MKEGYADVCDQLDDEESDLIEYYESLDLIEDYEAQDHIEDDEEDNVSMNVVVDDVKKVNETGISDGK